MGKTRAYARHYGRRMLYYAAGKAAQYAGRQLRSGATAAARRAMNIAYKKAGEYVSGKRKRAAPKASDPPAYQSKKVKRGRNGRRFESAVHGVWAGRFSKMSRKSGRGMDMYHKKGCVQIEELTGQGTDGNCVYAMAEVIQAKTLFRVTIGAIIRKLLEKGGFAVSGWDDTPWPAAAGSGTVGAFDGEYSVCLVMWDLDAGTNTNVLQSQSPTENTFAQVVDKFVDYIIDWSQQYGDFSTENDHEPYAFVLFKSVRNSGGTAVTAIKLAEILFGECRMTLSGSMTMKVQNRTRPNDSGVTNPDYNADSVEANPIQGRMYECKGVPRFKANGLQASTSGAYKFSQFYVAKRGLELFNPVNMDPTFKEPPPPGVMWNCNKSAKIRLDPGRIHSYGLTERRISVPVIRLWRSIHYNATDSAGGGFYTYNSFKVLLMGFEDVININSEYSDIKIAVEVERKLGCFCSERKNRFMKPQFEQIVLA